MVKRDLWHGILVDETLQSKDFLAGLELFAQRRSRVFSWTIFGVVVPNATLQSVIELTQRALKTGGSGYAHYYNDEEIVVVFSERVFRVGAHESTWRDVRAYGRQLDIPAAQLDFFPNRFQDETHYFSPEDFLQQGRGGILHIVD